MLAVPGRRSRGGVRLDNVLVIMVHEATTVRRAPTYVRELGANNQADPFHVKHGVSKAFESTWRGYSNSDDSELKSSSRSFQKM